MRIEIKEGRRTFPIQRNATMIKDTTGVVLITTSKGESIFFIGLHALDKAANKTPSTNAISVPMMTLRIEPKTIE